MLNWILREEWYNIGRKGKEEEILIETCAFCGKDLSQVTNLVKSAIDDGIYICDKCSEISYSIINGNINKKSAGNLRKNRKNTKNMEVLEKKTKWNDTDFDMTPKEIYEEIDKYVIGQDHAKKVLSVALYNHYHRLTDESGLIKKSNILLAGPSGCGKTLLARTLSKIINVPFATIDATSLTEAGYVGQDVEICLQRLLQIADNNISLAQQGIVFIDEIDKIARAAEMKSSIRDISGEGVQASLLKLIEGSEVSVPINSNRKNSIEDTILFNTRNVLFICGGAFETLFDDSSQNNPIGFQLMGDNSPANNPTKLSSDSLIKYGLMPEFVGRFPILCPLDALTTHDLVRILTEPKDAIIKEYLQIFAKDDVKLEFTDEALKKIANEAIKSQTSARALRSILEDTMLNIMYDIPSRRDAISKCIITKECIETGEPKIIWKRQRKKKSTATLPS